MCCVWQRNSYFLEMYLKQHHQSVYISVLGSDTAHVKTSGIKPFVAPEEDAYNLINSPSGVNQWLNVIVGNVCARFRKGRRVHGTKKTISQYGFPV